MAKISIIPRGVAALGYTQQQPTEDRYLMTQAELLDRLDVLLGGRIAEELAFGDVSTGAQDDLLRATDLAHHMVTRYGMGRALGLVAYPGQQRAQFLDVTLPSGGRDYREATAQAVDDEIRSLLDAAHARVLATLGECRETLDDLARVLMQREVVDRAALAEVMAGVRSRPTAAAERTERAPSDPVCGMRVPEGVAVATAEFAGQAYFFRSEGCEREFAKRPADYAGPGRA